MSAETTKSNGTISERTCVKLSLPAFIGLMIMVVGAALGWGGWITQSRYLLTREEAARTYITREEFKEWSTNVEKVRTEQFSTVNANLEAATRRLDRVLERMSKTQ